MDLHYEEVKVTARYAPWKTDKDFQEAYQAIKGYTLVEETRCWELWELLGGGVQWIEGDILEVGVWRGGTGCLLALRARQLGLNARVFLCDTFAGVPWEKISAADPVYHGGEHADAPVNIVQGLIHSLSLKNVEIVQGVFPKSFDGQKTFFRFVHIDADVYQSAKESTEFVLPRMSLRGAIVFDDYGFHTCGGVTKYVNELKDGRTVIHNLNGHAIVIV